ncbi:hypothetical protein PENANT_c006G01090 [Penicillium antarcticum]|uniref:Uncharacterized protein n=1 Tax=Penicillium antarcticum TaxID=416450 RepID=A0A1V6QDM5_9EURO|nr:hypothetical protein PENANT_c006G01090 [Penicillium antarcticum]
MSLAMVSEKLNELLRPLPANGAKPPFSLTDASASSRTIQALHHFYKGPGFSAESPKTVRIVMGKMVQLAFEEQQQPTFAPSSQTTKSTALQKPTTGNKQ